MGRTPRARELSGSEKTPVTVAQFRAYCDAAGYKFEWENLTTALGFGSLPHPMAKVTWDEAQGFW